MPAPASEDDLKRRARRRLIGAVALTLIAVIALPLLLEDEPPPATRLEVNMPPVAAQPEPAPLEASPPPEPAAVAETKPAPQESKPAAPEKSEPPPKPTPKPVVSPKPVTKPAPRHEASATGFVVQLGAFSDTEKVSALKAQTSKLGLPSYTDKPGALTRLRVGPFATHEAAINAATKLAKNGLAGQVMPK
ncbi:MAG: SPOR domain-containing protein [Thiobacillaceae bacterium]